MSSAASTNTCKEDEQLLRSTGICSDQRPTCRGSCGPNSDSGHDSSERAAIPAGHFGLRARTGKLVVSRLSRCHGWIRRNSRCSHAAAGVSAPQTVEVASGDSHPQGHSFLVLHSARFGIGERGRAMSAARIVRTRVS